MEIGNGSNGGLWIGRHSADGDTLVLDPARSTPGSANLSFFSLTQFRLRVFPPAVVESKIEEVVDPGQRAQARKQYKAWPKLKEERDRGLQEAATEAAARQKERVIEKHRLFLERRELPYEGVQDSSEPGKGSSAKRRRASCHTCRIPLDDFVGVRCAACGVVLCSCGACGCQAAQSES